LEPDWFRLQGIGTGLVRTTDRKGLVPQPKAKGWFSWFLRRQQIVFFSFLAKKIQNGKNIVFFFRGVDFSVAKFLFSLNF
jgi:hypothetical protein